MSKKRKSPDDQDFEESPRAGCSDQGRSNAQKWRCESWTKTRGDAFRVHSLHNLYSDMWLTSNQLSTPVHKYFWSLENNLTRCGLLFIISLQFPAESHLCDSSCRADNKSRTMPFATVIYAVHVCQHGKKASINCITPVRCGHRKKEDARRVLPSQTWLGSERKMWPRVSPIH